ncbi:hypothetical protein Pmani_025510 [Petrolisthes manimaculis]|uniref:Uncharacterized protein n=1 Tax=Petrolisthes manimaculis TaxID=1843537 RepID=A0AAE1P607_9EUCA|nr:hypothetical protein Pmani_025510 [Petrolisthes manimaculis]
MTRTSRLTAQAFGKQLNTYKLRIQQQRLSRPKLTLEHAKFGSLWKNHLEIPLQNSTAHLPLLRVSTTTGTQARRQAQEGEDQAKQTPLSLPLR